ncbi:hypothetical protein ACS0TY_032011 [Phlomoides rotata]
MEISLACYVKKMKRVWHMCFDGTTTVPNRASTLAQHATGKCRRQDCFNYLDQYDLVYLEMQKQNYF